MVSNSLSSEKWVGVHTGGAHYLDHLGVLCEGLGIPLIVSNPLVCQTARDFYPKLQIEYRDLSDLTLDFLAERANVIFESGHHFAIDLIPMWELIYGKKMRVVYCPHGNSDKKVKSRKDVSLVYGDHMQRLLQTTEEISRLERVVTTGNYRASYYQANQQWYDKRLNTMLEDKIQKRHKTVFYAPTWPDGSSRSLWFLQATRVIEEVGSVFNLLFRLHPFLAELYPAETEKLKHLCSQTPNVVDVSAFPSIYPILNQADFYLGDFSSVGYDFLYLNKPLFFVDQNEGEIYRCGITLNKTCHWGEAIRSFQDHLDWQTKRRQMSEKVFGEDRGFEGIKAKLEEALSIERASWTAL